jgi:DNA topoisomerase-1
VLRAIDRVAEQLNNTRAVCRKYYVHPAVFETYLAGTMLEHLQAEGKESAKEELRADEMAVVRLLQRMSMNETSGKNGKHGKPH